MRVVPDSFRLAGFAMGNGLRVAARRLLVVGTTVLTAAIAGAVLGVPSADAASDIPLCQGTFPSNGIAEIDVQSSPQSGILWSVVLAPVNSGLIDVTLSAQILVDSKQANVYLPHTEPWDYKFHGTLPRTFQVIGGGTYIMPPDAGVSFVFRWHSTVQPNRGGYAYLNCVYDA